MKRLIAFIVCALLCGAFSSCGLIVINHPDETSQTESAGESATGSTAESETEAPVETVERDDYARSKEYLDGIGDESWGGAVIKITSTCPMLTDSEDAPLIVSRAVEERAHIIEDKLGVVLTTQEIDANTLYLELSASVRSGMYYSNLLVLPQDRVFQFAAEGLLANLRSLPEFDLTAPYFNQSAIAAASAGYECYGVAGDLTYAPDEFECLFFSPDRIAERGLDAPYALVNSGKWTLDRYFEYCAEAGEYAPIVTGRYGDEAADAFYIGAGKAFMRSGVREYPAVAMFTETIDSELEPIKRVFSAPGALYRESGSIEAFIEKGLFMSERLSAMDTLAVSGTHWGILPMPKADEAQESYITPASGDSLMVAVPAGLFADVQSSKVLRVIAAASVGRIPQSFVDHAQYNLLQTNADVLMLDLILKNVRYDFAYTAGLAYANTASATYYALRNAVFEGTTASEAIAYFAPKCEWELSSAFRMD